VITVAVRGYLRYGLSSRDVEELPGRQLPKVETMLRGCGRGPARGDATVADVATADKAEVFVHNGLCAEGTLH
jgi:hypothetical protein